MMLLSPQLASAVADLPEEPAVTPTLQIEAKVTPENPKYEASQQEEAGVHRVVDVKAEEADQLPQVVPSEDGQEEPGLVHPELKAKTHANLDAGESATDAADSGSSGGERVTK